MKVGFIGLGNVGAKLAGSLVRHRFDVTVRDISAEAVRPLLEQGASPAGSGEALAKSSDAIITCLPSPEISARVMEEPEGSARRVVRGQDLA